MYKNEVGAARYPLF